MTTTSEHPRAWVIPTVLKGLARRPELAPGMAEALKCSEAALWQAVLRVIDEPEWIERLPVETARLRRLRDQRKAARTGKVDP